MASAFDQVVTGTATGVITLTTAAIAPAGANRVLLVCIGYDEKDAISTVVKGAASLTLIGASTGTDYRVDFYGLIAPSIASEAIVVTFTDVLTKGAFAFVVSLTGVLQTSVAAAFTNFTSAFARTASPSITVSSASGNLVIDALAALTDRTFSVGSGQTQNNGQLDPGANPGGASSREAGAGSVVMDWTISGIVDEWTLAGINIVAAAAPPAAGIRSMRQLVGVGQGTRD